MRSDDRPILVLGATGTTGSRVVGELLAAGRAVRAASRSADPAAASGAAEPVRFDWHDAATHGPAVAGVRAVYVVPPPGFADAGLVLPFLPLAREAGVDRVVLLSSSAIEAGGPGVGAVHAALPESGLGWAVLRPSWFQQNLTNPHHHLGAAVARGADLVTATGTGRVGLIDAGDIAAVAAALLTAEEAPNRDLVLTGPEALDYDTAAERLPGPSRHRAVTEAESAAHMVAAGIPADVAAGLAAMEIAIAGGAEDRITNEVESVLGRRPRRLAHA